MKGRSFVLLSTTAIILFVVIFLPEFRSSASKTADLETVVFQETGAPQLDRFYSNATLLQSDKVLITGGFFAAQAEIYDPFTETFIFTGYMNADRNRHTSTLLQDGNVLITGGYNPPALSYLSSAEIYDPNSGNFSTTTDTMIRARCNHTATLLADGRVLIAGGWSTDGEILSSAEIYDPETDTFSLVGDMGYPRSEHTANLLSDGRVLITGGYGGMETIHTSSEIFDPSTEAFSLTGNMNISRHTHAGTLLNDGTVLITGGMDVDFNQLVTAEIYDPISGAFKYVGSMSTGFRRHTAALLMNGKVLVAGGDGSGVVTNLYDPLSETFSRANDMVHTREHHASTLLPSGKVLIVGGSETFRRTAELAELVLDNDLPTGTILANDGALSTTSKDIQLTLEATDTTSGVGEMRFGDDGLTWDSWMPFSTNKSYQLSGEDGMKTVFVQFRDYPGNVSDPISYTIELNTSVGDDYNLSINNGELFTNNVTVTLSSGAEPFTSQMLISNDGGFAGATWEPYSANKEWQITQYGHYVIPRVVYIKFKDIFENVSSVYQDDIILDVTPPSGSIRLLPITLSSYLYSEPTVTLELQATDDVSGVRSMRISTSPTFLDSYWQNYRTLIEWIGSYEQVYYAQFRDNAGNISPTYSTTGQIYLFLPFLSDK